jgi:biotin carboxyl carrier protein
VSEQTKRIEWNGDWREINADDLRVEELSAGHYLVRDGERTFEVFESNGKLSDGRALDGVELRIETKRERIIRERFQDLNVAGKGADSKNQIVKAPMPGMVRSVMVSAGDIVERQTTLLVLEAMKMENNILAGMQGRIVRVHATEGKSVERNAALVEIELQK